MSITQIMGRSSSRASGAVRTTYSPALGPHAARSDARSAADDRRDPGPPARRLGDLLRARTPRAPVLRGFQGERVRVLTDGIGSLDVSNTSVDHAVAINPLPPTGSKCCAGPSALLFGSSAIGGVVNVIDTRIPRRVPDEAGPCRGARSRYGSAADERLGQRRDRRAARRPFRRPCRRQLQQDRRPRTGGYMLSPALREQARGQPRSGRSRRSPTCAGGCPTAPGGAGTSPPAPPVIDGEQQCRLLDQPATTASTAFRSAISLDPAVEAEAPRIDLKQTRVDGRAEIAAGGGFVDRSACAAAIPTITTSSSRTRARSAPPSSTRAAKAASSGSDATAAAGAAASAPNISDRDARIRGDEKFLPDSAAAGRPVHPANARSAARSGRGRGCASSIQPAPRGRRRRLGNAALAASFTTFSGSLGGSYAFAPGWRFGLDLSRSERAPSIEELFANGPHAGTQAFEIGDPDLDREEQLWGRGNFRGSRGPVQLHRAPVLQPLQRLHLPGADRRDPRRSAGVPVSARARPTIYGFEVQAIRPSSAAIGIS